MPVKELTQSTLRTRVLRVFPMIPGYSEPCHRPRSYLVLGDSSAIRDFEAQVSRAWPRRGTFLI